jgi:hypothetical protein
MGNPMTDAEHLRGLADQLRTARRPVCPQFRPVSAKWIYPVEGYCVLAGASGQLMIPSIEEYREFCTAGRSAACPWFQTPPYSLPPRPGPADAPTCPEGSTSPGSPGTPPPSSPRAGGVASGGPRGR